MWDLGSLHMIPVTGLARLAERILSSVHMKNFWFTRCKNLTRFSLFVSFCFAVRYCLKCFCFLCFTSSVSFTGSYTEVKPKFQPGYRDEILYVIACTEILTRDFLGSNSKHYVIFTHSTSENHFCKEKS